MIYIFFIIINTVYGILILLTLSRGTTGYSLVLTIGSLLTILGGTGLYFYFRAVTSHLQEKPKREAALKSWYELVRSIDIVLVAALMIRAFVIQPFIVEGNSMEPNFHNAEYLLVDKLSFRLRNPHRGEVIIFIPPNNPQDDYIKRIIAIPGDTILINDGKVYVNNIALSETYLGSDSITNTLSNGDKILQEKLANNEYFVMGDNRDHSSDSRDWGPVPKKNLIGRPLAIIYPFKYFSLVHNPSVEISA